MTQIPVCGMKKEEKDAAAKDEYKGKAYYFDSEECMSKFHQDPKKYVDKEEA